MSWECGTIDYMGLFRRNRLKPEQAGFKPYCPYCFGNNTSIANQTSAGQDDFVKVWRGQRQVACQCLDCRKKFYADEPVGGLTDESIIGYEIISDPEELQAAEEQQRKDIEESDDRRCW